MLRIGVACLGRVSVTVDGDVVIDGHLKASEGEFGSGLLSPPSLFADVAVTAGQPLSLLVRNDIGQRDELAGAASIILGTIATSDDDDARIATAANIAAQSDVAIVLVGRTDRDASEGFDRRSLTLPGRQDDLVNAVLAANPRTVVVVNAGAPVVMPWHERPAALIAVWFPGQEFGNALADVVLGYSEPGGRLPTTWPARQADVLVLSTTPSAGVLTYGEGVHIGYRAWLKAHRKPAYAFGHGLGYTTFTLSGFDVPAEAAPGDDVSVRVSVTNTGGRSGKAVVQLYLSRCGTSVDRPATWLASFATVNVAAGKTDELVLSVRSRAFQHWANGWQTEPGSFEVHVGEARDKRQLAGHLNVVNRERASA